MNKENNLVFSRLAIAKQIENYTKNNPIIKDIQDNLFLELQQRTLDPWNKEYSTVYNQGEKRGVSSLDMYDMPPIKDPHLEYLNGLLGDSEQFVRTKTTIIENNEVKRIPIDPEITERGITNLNYILDMTAKQSKRDGIPLSYWKLIFKDLCTIHQDPLSKKEKIYFNISSKADYFNFLEIVSTFPSTEGNTNHEASKNLVQKYRLSTFLKNLNCYSDLAKDPIYQQKRNLFTYTCKDVLGKFCNKSGEEFEPELCLDPYTKEYYFHIDVEVPFYIDGEDKPIMVRIIGNTKSQNSSIDKQRRDVGYTGADALNDLNRFSIIVPNHEELIKVYYQLIKYGIEDPEKVFQDNFLEKAKIKDKGIINHPVEEARERILSLPDDDAGNFLKKQLDMNKVLKLIEERNGDKSKQYKDSKILLPIRLRGKEFAVETKLLLQNFESTNEEGFADHRIFRLEQDLLKESRDKKFILNEDILQKCKDLVEEYPDLKEKISPGNYKETANEIYKYLQAKYLQPIGIKGYEIKASIHKKIYTNLKENNCLPWEEGTSKLSPTVQ